MFFLQKKKGWELIIWVSSLRGSKTEEEIKSNVSKKKEIVNVRVQITLRNKNKK